ARNGMTSDYARALGARLRAIRTQQGLSLHGVEKKSKGRWKAVVVGSYERGDRAVTVQKLAELADFYGVPVSELLPEGRTASSAAPAQKIVLNLERLFQLPPDQVGPLARYAQAIQSQRGDYNNKVLSIRGEDLRSLSIIYDLSEGELTERLIEWGVLAPDSAPGAPVEPAGPDRPAGRPVSCRLPPRRLGGPGPTWSDRPRSRPDP